MELLVLCLVCVLPATSHLYTESLATPPELYGFHGVTYGIYLEKVTFTEARLLCRSKQGSLVEFHNDSVALFLGRALSESAVGFSPLWIGGVYTPRRRGVHDLGVWKWLSGEQIDEPIATETVFPMSTLPFWVVRPNLTLTYDQCLVVDRNNHFMPAISGEGCSSLRPYICALLDDSYAVGPVEVRPPVELEYKTYHVFRGRSTWVEALTFCRRQSYQLAVVRTLEEFDKLQKHMHYARPMMQNAWIGGVFLDGKWTWAATGQDIPTFRTTNVCNGTGKRAPPPWARLIGGKMNECLLADRHLCDLFTYIEALCERRRSFVCEIENSRRQRDGLMRVPVSSLWVSTIQLGWQDAQNLCARCINGSLMQLLPYVNNNLEQQMRAIFTGMTQSGKKDIRHIWVDGHLTTNNSFVWGDSSDHATPLDSTLGWFNDKGQRGLVLFAPGDLTSDPALKEFRCLNMDRENTRHYVMYGLNCDLKQHFMCMPQGKLDGQARFFADNSSSAHLAKGCTSLELAWPGT